MCPGGEHSAAAFFTGTYPTKQSQQPWFEARFLHTVSEGTFSRRICKKHSQVTQPSMSKWVPYLTPSPGEINQGADAHAQLSEDSKGIYTFDTPSALTEVSRGVLRIRTQD